MKGFGSLHSLNTKSFISIGLALGLVAYISVTFLLVIGFEGGVSTVVGFVISGVGALGIWLAILGPLLTWSRKTLSVWCEEKYGDRFPEGMGVSEGLVLAWFGSLMFGLSAFVMAPLVIYQGNVDFRGTPEIIKSVYAILGGLNIHPVFSRSFSIFFLYFMLTTVFLSFLLMLGGPLKYWIIDPFYTKVSADRPRNKNK